VSVRESHYSVLQVDPAAEQEVIEAAYRRLSRKYHPDVNSSPEASERMRAINAAYATLSTPSRRAIYDRERRQAGIQERLDRLRPPTQMPRGPRAGAEQRALVERYRAATAPVAERAAATMAAWAAEWAVGLDAIVTGDGRGRRRVSAAGQKCVAELTECLAEWEQVTPPDVARRLADLSAACLKLELALVRGSLSFAEGDDFSVLQPLAGLAERIGSLTRTIAAEAVFVSRPAA
jgi:hypothetical protein